MFIKLTTAYETKIWVNVQHIISIEGYNKGSLLNMRGSRKDVCVQETPDEIAQKLLEMNEKTVRLWMPEARGNERMQGVRGRDLVYHNEEWCGHAGGR